MGEPEAVVGTAGGHGPGRADPLVQAALQARPGTVVRQNQDLSREFLRSRGYDGPLVSPRESAAHLLAIAADHDFTLFEYFQTDLMAHKGTPDDVRRVLSRLDEFLEGLLAWPNEPGHLLLLTSDHGNIEDSRTKVHTENPVPLVAVGEGAEVMKAGVKSLTYFVPTLLELYPQKKLET